MTRRGFALRLAGGLVGAALGACGRSRARAAADAAACTLYPQQTEGPYYLDRDLLRRDITGGRPGLPLGLDLRIVSAATCAALADVAVDVWHCDAGGVYSGYPGQLGGADTRGETFLRGTQVSGADGRVRFDTVYPGWYPGRTTHVHFKVHVGAREATSQLYFPEEVTAAVYAKPPYAARRQKDTSNAADGVTRSGGLPPLAAPRAHGSGYVATVTIAVAA
jgi:protocatechuate 3,4-dioxygenase beta subunit